MEPLGAAEQAKEFFCKTIMSILTKKHCISNVKSIEPLTDPILAKYLEDLGGNWMIVNDHHIEKEFTFKDFKEALIFANKVGELVQFNNMVNL